MHRMVAVVLILLCVSVVEAQRFRPARPDRPFAPQRQQAETGDLPADAAQNPPPAANPHVDRSAPLDKQVDRAITAGVQYLRMRQNANGSWGDGGRSEPNDIGRTALVGLALLSCGVSHQSPEIVKATQFLKQAKIGGIHQTYCVSLRAAFYSQLPESLRKAELQADLKWLEDALIRRGNHAGMYTYFKIEGPVIGSADFSNSQYGVLGVWYAAMAGLEVDTAYWRLVEDGWRAGQSADGGWGYRQRDGSYASMTAAGLATLYITYDYLHAQKERDLARVHINSPVERGLVWMGNNFAVDQNLGLDPRPDRAWDDALTDIVAGRPRTRQIGRWVHYMLFGYERVGEASGLTRFGPHKWFEEGARFLIETQAYDGSWEGSTSRAVDTSYALLFLSRGRAPVALQKLQTRGRWNNRSRDAATFVKWLSRQSERHTNWQIVPVEASAAEFREAPILYLVSDRAVVLRPADRDRIKTFIDQGGMLLAINEGTNRQLVESIEKLASEMYPSYEFRDLPRDHLIYTANFPVKNFPTTPRALSNGVRELIVLLPTGDISWKLQQGAGTNNPAAAPVFSFLANCYVYMNDKSNPRFKGDDTWIDPDPKVRTQHEVFIHRMRFSSNWNPEPMGWTRLANVLHNADGIKLNIVEIDPAVSSPMKSAALVHMTCTTSFELSTDQQNALKKYLDAGGVLFFDAAGGSATAQIAFETLIAKLYPGEKLKTLPIEHPIYTGAGTGGIQIRQVSYRRFAADRIARTTLPRLKVLEVNGRIVAIASSEDISAGLVGYRIDGIVGYSPESSTEITHNIIKWAMSESR